MLYLLESNDKLYMSRRRSESYDTRYSIFKQTTFYIPSSSLYFSLKEPDIEQRQTTWLWPVQRTAATRQNHYLTLDDHNRLNSIKVFYDRALRCSSVKRDISVFNGVIDRRSALLYLTSNFCNIGVQLITFIRNTPEFESLNGHDRFILVKYNSSLLMCMYRCLHFDVNRDLVIDAEVESEEYAIAVQQISRCCYGMEVSLQMDQLCRSIKKITDDDPIILQLMIIIMTFVKGNEIEEIIMNEELSLLSNKQVYEGQSTYTSLLFRYMIEKYSGYYQAVRQYSQLIQKIMQTQMLVQTYRKLSREQLADASDDEIHPILKSALDLHYKPN